MTYNPIAYATDPAWGEWVAAEYEAVVAERECTEGPDQGGHPTFAAMESALQYEATSRLVADEIEDATELRLAEAERLAEELGASPADFRIAEES